MPYSDGSRSHVTEFFGDAEYKFDLMDKDWSLMIELETKVGSVLPFFHRVRAGDFRTNELRELLRLALIGGGQTPQDAARLISTYFDRHPLSEHLHIAIGVVGAILFGVDEPEPEPEPAAEVKEEEPANAD